MNRQIFDTDVKFILMISIDLHRPTLRKLRAEDMFETWVSLIFLKKIGTVGLLYFI